MSDSRLPDQHGKAKPRRSVRVAAWLVDVTEEIVSGQTPINRIDELLAWNWKAASTASIGNAA
jgi:hypothetical protein